MTPPIFGIAAVCKTEDVGKYEKFQLPSASIDRYNTAF